MSVISGFNKQARYMRINNNGDDKLVSEWTSTDTVDSQYSAVTNSETTLNDTTSWNNTYDNKLSLETGKENSQPTILTDMFSKLTCAFNNIKWLRKKSDATDQSITTLNNQVEEILEMIYPVGSLYWSRSNINPTTLFGGTWVQIRDKFILAAGSIYGIGTTGGHATVSYTPQGTVEGHTLTQNEMPAHSHSIPALSGTTQEAGEHQHLSAFPIPQPAFGVAEEQYPIEVMMTDVETGRDTSSAGAHTHDFSTGASNTGSSGSSGSHSHGFTGTASTISTMPPYDTFYCWERVG